MCDAHGVVISPGKRDSPARPEMSPWGWNRLVPSQLPPCSSPGSYALLGKEEGSPGASARAGCAGTRSPLQINGRCQNLYRLQTLWKSVLSTVDVNEVWEAVVVGSGNTRWMEGMSRAGLTAKPAPELSSLFNAPAKLGKTKNLCCSSRSLCMLCVALIARFVRGPRAGGASGGLGLTPVLLFGVKYG